MQTQILEGTYTEIRQQFIALPVKPETRLRVVISEPEAEDNIDIPPFTPTEFRNGLPLLPLRELPEPITMELIKRLSEDDDEEILSVYRNARR